MEKKAVKIPICLAFVFLYVYAGRSFCLGRKIGRIYAY